QLIARQRDPADDRDSGAFAAFGFPANPDDAIAFGNRLGLAAGTVADGLTTLGAHLALGGGVDEAAAVVVALHVGWRITDRGVRWGGLRARPLGAASGQRQAPAVSAPSTRLLQDLQPHDLLPPQRGSGSLPPIVPRFRRCRRGGGDAPEVGAE